MIELTEMERNTLMDMTDDDFYQSGVDSVFWTDAFLDFSRYNSKITRDILSSLVKKNIIKVTKGEDSIIYFTDLGKQVMRELGY